jgi:hypothetical protein
MEGGPAGPPSTLETRSQNVLQLLGACTMQWLMCQPAFARGEGGMQEACRGMRSWTTPTCTCFLHRDNLALPCSCTCWALDCRSCLQWSNYSTGGRHI